MEYACRVYITKLFVLRYHVYLNIIACDYKDNLTDHIMRLLVSYYAQMFKCWNVELFSVGILDRISTLYWIQYPVLRYNFHLFSTSHLLISTTSSSCKSTSSKHRATLCCLSRSIHSTLGRSVDCHPRGLPSPPVGEISTSRGWGVNRHTTRFTSTMFVV